MSSRKLFVTVSATLLISGIGLTAFAIDHPNRPPTLALLVAASAFKPVLALSSWAVAYPMNTRCSEHLTWLVR